MLPLTCDSKISPSFSHLTANIHTKHGSRHRGFGQDPEFQPTKRGWRSSIRVEIPPFVSPSACLGLDHVDSSKLHCELSSISKQSLHGRVTLHRAASSLGAGGISGKVLLTVCFPI